MPSHGGYKTFLPGEFQMSLELDHLRAQIFPKWPSSQSKGRIRADGMSLGGLISAFESSWLPPSVLSQKLLFPKVVDAFRRNAFRNESERSVNGAAVLKSAETSVVWAWKITCSGLALRKLGAVGKSVSFSQKSGFMVWLWSWHSQAMWLWASNLTSLSLSFMTLNIKISNTDAFLIFISNRFRETTRQFCSGQRRVKWDSLSFALNHDAI